MRLGQGWYERFVEDLPVEVGVPVTPEQRVYRLLHAATEVGTQTAWDEAVSTAHALWLSGGLNVSKFSKDFPHAKHWLAAIMEYEVGKPAPHFEPEAWVVQGGIRAGQMSLTRRQKIAWGALGFGIGVIVGIGIG